MMKMKNCRISVQLRQVVKDIALCAFPTATASSSLKMHTCTHLNSSYFPGNRNIFSGELILQKKKSQAKMHVLNVSTNVCSIS